MGRPKRLFNKDFLVLCLSSTLFMFSFSMIIPELPVYLNNLGGEDYLGFIIGLFTISAGLSRLWSGRFADKTGRIKIMLFGSLVTMVCGGLYIYTTTVFSFLLLRFIHGLSTGYRPTGTTTYLIDITPPERMGEAMGFLGMAGSTGMALGPALGSVLKEEFSFELMFIFSSIFGFLSVILTLLLKEHVNNRSSLSWSDFNIFKGKVLDFSTLNPSVITFFDVFAFGVLLTTSPILVESLGFKYKGVFNLIFASVSILTRFVAGKYSDKYGRIYTLKRGLVMLIIGLVIISIADSKLMVIVGAVFYGISIGINRPTIFAWSADVANPLSKASSIATMLLALEIGIGGGAFISGFLYDSSRWSINLGLYVAIFFGIIGLLYVLKLGKQIQV